MVDMVNEEKQLLMADIKEKLESYKKSRTMNRMHVPMGSTKRDKKKERYLAQRSYMKYVVFK